VTDPNFTERAASGLPAPSTSAGASSYFSQPEQTLDPNLFHGEYIRPEVRERILTPLEHWLASNHLNVAHGDIRAWLAGSGITYQWAASRGNGDLDVMVSFDVTTFEQKNPAWRGWSEVDLAGDLNDAMKAGLWPSTSATQLGNQLYDITYFWNPGTKDDIRHIHPYAAFDVIHDTWVVRPPRLGERPGDAFPKSWYNQASQDSESAERLTGAYNHYLSRLSASSPGSSDHHNAGAALNAIVAEAGNLFTDLHTGRRAAFSAQGQGYGDYANFRWQHGKLTGAVQALHEIAQVGVEARKAQETEQWGAPIDGAEIALRRAAQQYRGRGTR